MQPVRTWQGGKWEDLDTTLVRRPDGTWSPKAATVGLFISGGGDSPFVTMRQAGKTMSVGWPGSLPQPHVQGNTATFSNVLPDVDLVVRADVDGYSHLLVVKSAEAAANPDLARIELPVETGGVRLEEQPGGGIAAVESGAGGPVFEAPEPIMWDSSTAAAPAGVMSRATSAGVSGESEPGDLREGPGDDSQVAPVGLEVRDDAFVLTPDAQLLASATYPLYIDPVAKTYTRSGWAMVSSYHSRQEHWKFSDDEGVGRCPADVSSLCASSNDVKRQFYAVPTSSLAGKDIISAEFAITLTSAYNGTARSVALSRVNSTGSSAISSSTNWSNQPSSKAAVDTASTSARAGSCTSTNQNLRFNAKSAVQQAADSGWATTTFRLAAGDESGYAYWNRFCGNGQLEVTYNRPPLAPSQSTMSISPGGACVHGASRPYTDSLPMMYATIQDYDHNDNPGQTETLKAQFEVSWTPSGGSTVTKTFTTGTATTSSVSSSNTQTGQHMFSAKVGTSGTVSAPSTYTIPENVVVSWRARGNDGTAWGDWSPVKCEFMYGHTTPAPPEVTSSQYPDDDQWHPGVGDEGSFTFTSASSDVVAYRYFFDGEPQLTVNAGTGAGKPATIRWTPMWEGPHDLTVFAVDAAGKSQKNPNGYPFLVGAGRLPAAVWKLDDAAGAPQAAGRPGDPVLTAGSGAIFGVDQQGDQKSRVAVKLDGTDGGYLSTSGPVVATDKSFAVAAWVYLPSLPSQDMTVVSQDGTGGAGFSLGYDGATQKWVFRTPVTPLDSMGDWRVVDSTPAVAGIWTHLVGEYDAVKQQLLLYKQGVPAAAPVSRPTPWNADGGLQIGRELAMSGYTNAFTGSVSEVQVYDRMVSEEELAAAQGSPPELVSYWPLEDVLNGVSPEASGQAGLALGSGASIYHVDASCEPELDPECAAPESALTGDGHLLLDGTPESYASRDAGLLARRGSFAIAAQARMGSALPRGDETVMSLAGPNATAVVVRYSAAHGKWQLVVTDQDAATPQETSADDSAGSPQTTGRGDHLTLAFDAVTGVVSLYVNGQFGGSQVVWPNTWDFSTVSVQVGRRLTGSVGSEFFSGALDEVRVYQGVVDARRAVEIYAASSSA
ncbi:LamG-like jellyroll fold domain-containing protein [Planotetraspora thailandica]|uniref:LamG domain-containing protein n=1 Tax=Planotetraspora thailandica TaxID=487172 RepID=UPI00194EE5B2|nr:LamG domain-containing protein [Planotetraspora thailandica]